MLSIPYYSILIVGDIQGNINIININNKFNNFSWKAHKRTVIGLFFYKIENNDLNDIIEFFSSGYDGNIYWWKVYLKKVNIN